MGWIWTGFLLISVLCGCYMGNIGNLSSAMMEGAAAGISLTISMAGPICLWSGVFRLMEAAGWSRALARWIAPLLRRLFPRAWQDPEARDALCGNFSANLLGLGNAATPMGIQAAAAMARQADGQTSDELCRLVVMNTASIQLLPATVAAVRSAMDCGTPFDILPAVWITSACSVTVGLLAAKVFSRWVP